MGPKMKPWGTLSFKISQLSEDFIIGDWTKNKIFRWCDFTWIDRHTPEKIAKRNTLGLQNTNYSGKEVTKALDNGGCVWRFSSVYIYSCRRACCNFCWYNFLIADQIYLGKRLCLAIDLYSNCSYIFSLGYSLCCVVVDQPISRFVLRAFLSSWSLRFISLLTSLDIKDKDDLWFSWWWEGHVYL